MVHALLRARRSRRTQAHRDLDVLERARRRYGRASLVDRLPILSAVSHDLSASAPNPACASAAWTDITESVAAVKPRILAQCDRWEAFVESLADEDLVGEFEYQNTRGEPFRRVRHPVLDHVFNHGTHHRGQISAIVTRLGQPAPAMDLLYFLAEDA